MKLDACAPGRIAVYGAYGHTGRFVVAELLRRGWTPVLCGRDADQLQAMAADLPELDWKAAAIDDAAALDRALQGTVGVIHCAGPFLDTGAPLLQAALRAGVPYLDCCAEQRAVLDLARDYDAPARAAGVVAVPAMAFFGGLADLLATAALQGASDAERIDVAVGLDSWHATTGTRLTGQRNQWPRVVVSGGQLTPLASPPPQRLWSFPPPFGEQEALALPLSETVTLSRHLHCDEVHSYMNLAPVRDVRDPDTPLPQAADASGRSAQRFVVDVRVQRQGRVRRALAQGRDIYAVSAPLLVEAMERVLDGRVRGRGVLSPGAAFDARDFLACLSPNAFSVSYPT
ncbi:saccharopine dehydrogenase NADP-binding domain-containing protein [Lysobacter silvisoli]|uniref:Saccharopine dehydrogenase n=1 Tax=Lysobacter silvisoli TaxID=2293254 RepID=A0A371K008_9GAMM|nr:saccharopine dehydrogenase NADP-binding domain-containing protein [Lysobacter silvisoli]RDZ27253.1 saccharopine dehydrogenase [Lysobacter silvisoli]